MDIDEYREYLSSDEWKVKRIEFLEAYDYECQECGSNKNLEVHHLNYDNIGEEEEGDVEVLCHECHMEEHGQDDDYGEI